MRQGCIDKNKKKSNIKHQPYFDFYIEKLKKILISKYCHRWVSLIFWIFEGKFSGHFLVTLIVGTVFKSRTPPFFLIFSIVVGFWPWWGDFSYFYSGGGPQYWKGAFGLWKTSSGGQDIRRVIAIDLPKKGHISPMLREIVRS